MRPTLGLQEISAQMSIGLWYLRAFLLGSLFWSDPCGCIYFFLCCMWDQCTHYR